MICPQCGATFKRYASQVRWRGARYCSKRCQGQATAKPTTVVCQQCGRVSGRSLGPQDRMKGRGKFCGTACYEAYRRADLSRRVTLTCATCGEVFTRVNAWVKKAKSATYYCSTKCASAARQREGRHPHNSAGWKRLAEKVRARDGYKCVRCLTPDGASKQERLQVDHRVPYRMLADTPAIADDERNLSALCPSCHGHKTHHVEPRMLRGDFLALDEFYGPGSRAMAEVLFAEARAVLA